MGVRRCVVLARHGVYRRVCERLPARHNQAQVQNLQRLPARETQVQLQDMLRLPAWEGEIQVQ